MESLDYHGKKLAILGYGLEGKSAYRYWNSLGAEITICDANVSTELPPGVKSELGPDYLKNLDQFDLIVRSQSVLPHTFSTTKPVTSVTNEFLAICPGLVIGVTGTKGKGTTASVIYEILQKAGKQAFLGGNIGKPPLDFLREVTAGSVTVLELSNTQLWDVTHSPQIAVLLHLAPEHLDWHRGSVEEYMGTKANITKFQTKDDLLVYNAANPYAQKIAMETNAKKRQYITDKQSQISSNSEVAYVYNDKLMYGPTEAASTGDVQIRGPHNLGNICAAIAAIWDVVEDKGAIGEGIRAFKGLPHRLELVGEHSGVKYYDDSIATHEDAAIAAMRSFTEPKVLILGGSDKGADFTQLATEVVKCDIRGIVLLEREVQHLPIGPF